jgi:hypothetical protein
MPHKELVIPGAVKSHQLSLRGRKRMDDALRHWADCEVLVTIEKAHATRSKAQNDLYWAGYVNPLAEYCGVSPKWMHAYLKKRFLPKQRIEIVDKRTGVVIDEQDLEALSTTPLNKIEFGDYLREIEEFVIDHHIPVRVGSNREQVA